MPNQNQYWRPAYCDWCGKGEICRPLGGTQLVCIQCVKPRQSRATGGQVAVSHKEAAHRLSGGGKAQGHGWN